MGVKMLKGCSVLLFCALLTPPQGAQGYRPVLIIKQKASEKDVLDFVSHVLHGQSLANKQRGSDPGGRLPGAGGAPLTGSQPSLLGSLLSAVGRLLGGKRAEGRPDEQDLLFRRLRRAAPPAGDLPVAGPLSAGALGSAGLLGSELSKVVGLRIEEVTGPNVTLDIFSNSVVEMTLKLKLRIAVESPVLLVGEVIKVEVLKDITIAVRMGDSRLVLQDCKTPLGYTDIKVLTASSRPLVTEILTLLTGALDNTLPRILQNTLCPVINAVVASLGGTSLSSANVAMSPPGGNLPYSILKMSFNPDVIVLELTGRNLIEQILPLLPDNPSENAPLPSVPQI